MSFMNPVDMVEEDAADLQFPKDTAIDDFIKNENILVAKSKKNTIFTTRFYNPLKFSKQIEQVANTISTAHQDGIDAGAGKCATCNRTLQEPYIKCADCPSGTCLCLQCFARGCEIGEHRNNHAYIIIRDDIQVFPGSGGWTARDERIMLHTLCTQGYGNWEAVSRSLNNRHSLEDCSQHYHDHYFGGLFERLLGLTHHSQVYFPQRMPYVYKMRSLDPPRHDDITSMQFEMHAGYRFARGDFDTPYDGSAEGLLTIMQDTPLNDGELDDPGEFIDTSLKEELQTALIRAYNHRLSERQRRYRVMRDNGLIMANRTISWMLKYANAFRTDTNRTRFLAFIQICDPIKFDEIIESFRYYTDLQRTLFRLHELRQNGVRSLSGGRYYFKLKRQRQASKCEQAKARQNTLYDWRKLIVDGNAQLQSVHGFTPNTRKKPGPIEIIGLPGFVKLNEGERTLCSNERIMPQSYLEYKNMLIAENAKVGNLRLADARRLIKIDVNKTRQIYDFLIEHGYINKPS